MHYIASLTTEEIEQLQDIIQGSISHRERLRAQEILWSHKGFKIKQIVALCEVDRDTVSRWFSHFRSNLPNVVTLPQYFKQNGYHTEWWGKLFHAALLDSVSWTTQGLRYEPEDNWRAYVSKENIQIANNNERKGPSFEKANVPDNSYPDGKIADSAIEALNRLKNNDQPFFLAVGFYKPHLPFNVPKKYWDLYNPRNIELPKHMYPPENVPEIALTNLGELRSYSDIPKEGELTNEKSIQMIHGYRASVSYTDAQVDACCKQLKTKSWIKTPL